MDEKTNQILEKFLQDCDAEVEGLLALCQMDVLTKDGYGTVLRFLSKLSPVQGKLILLALVKKGYPRETAQKIWRIMGWNQLTFRQSVGKQFQKTDTL